MDAGKHSTRPIRVLHVVGGMSRGGVETWLMHMLRHVDRDRLKMDFLVHTTSPCPYDDEIRSLGSEVLPCLHPSRPWSYARNFRHILKKHGPYDVVHSHVHHFSGYVLRLAHRVGVPIRIAHSHNDTTAVDRKAGLIRQAYLGLSERWVRRHATLGLAVSRKAAAALFGESWEDDPRRDLFYLGVDLEPFRLQPDRERVRAELGLPADAFVVGHVGRFSEQKNHAFLIEIFEEIIEREPAAYLLLVGTGELRPDIEQRVKRAGLEGRAVFAGNRPDVPRLMMGAMDVFLFPSFYEGLPLVGLEAQAAGLPSILSDAITPEVVVVPELIKFLSITLAPAAWAEAALGFRRGLGGGTRQSSLCQMINSKFHIIKSSKYLIDYYII